MKHETPNPHSSGKMYSLPQNDPKRNEELIDSYDYLANAATSMDCTGLIPANPNSKAALESYNEVYHFEPPKVKIADPDANQPPK